MIKYTCALLLTLLLNTSFSHAEDTTLIDNIERDARTWLQTLDRAEYADGWKSASSLLQKATPEAKWVNTTRSIRKPLGTMQNRYLASAGTIETVEGFPDGEYVIVHFYTQFQHKPLVLETVTLLEQNKGNWSIIDYATRQD